MRWFSTLKIDNDLQQALRDIQKDLKTRFKNKKADLGLLFISPRFRNDVISLWRNIRNDLPIKYLIGCTGGGIIGGGREEEKKAAIGLTAAIMPKVNIKTFHINQEQLPGPDDRPQAWRDLFEIPLTENPHFIVIPDPFTIEAEKLVEGLDFAYPKSAKIGGLVSGGIKPKDNLLFCNDKVFYQGAVGVALSGNLKIEPIVAQGCRPIGRTATITEVDHNVLLKVDGKPPLEFLQLIYAGLDEGDKELFHTSLFLGIVMDPFEKNPKHGDFLIRNIVGIDQEQGIMAIGARIHSGQKVQFHLRDKVTSHDDLDFMLGKVTQGGKKKKFVGTPAPAGAVLFSCMGRGKGLYDKENHDSNMIRNALGQVAVGGFFCNGEIGPVGGKTYLHGYTSSIALIQAKK